METDAKLREVLHQGWMLKVDLEGRLAWERGAREDMIQPVHPGGGQSWLQVHTCPSLQEHSEEQVEALFSTTTVTCKSHHFKLFFEYLKGFQDFL